MKKTIARAIDRGFGVEIEFPRFVTASRDAFPFYGKLDVSTSLLKRVVQGTCVRDKVRTVEWETCVDNDDWVCKTDNSCGFELASPVLRGHDDLRKLVTVVGAFKKLGFTSDESCGTHVHVNMRGVAKTDVSKIPVSWIKSEKVLSCAFPRHRVVGEYSCFWMFDEDRFDRRKRWSNSEVFTEASNHNMSRRKALYASFENGRETIEFRAMEGSFEPRDVKNWTLFCLAFCDRAMLIEPTSSLGSFSFDDFWEFMGFDEQSIKGAAVMKRWFLDRIEKFGRNKKIVRLAEKRFYRLR